MRGGAERDWERSKEGWVFFTAITHISVSLITRDIKEASVSSSVIHSPPWDLNYYCMRKTMTRVQWDSSTKILIVWDNKSPLWPSNKCYSRSPLHMHLSCIGFHSICGGDIGAQLSPFPLSSILNLSSRTCNEWPCKMRTKSTHSHSILATFLLSKPCQSCYFFLLSPSLSAATD